MSLLEVDGLSIRYGAGAVVDDLSFAVEPGEAVGLVGESGSGKSQTALAIMGLLPAAAAVAGAIRFAGTDLGSLGRKAMNRLRSVRLSMVFQDPSLALNPYLPVGRQLTAVLEAHGLARGSAARARAEAALRDVGLPDPRRQLAAYPHELSGGMRQRVMIAAALLGEPDLLIADEPTTALDVTVQAQILELLDRVRDTTALLLITHDLGVIAGHCERMLVMESGSLVESGSTATVFRAPSHPATRALIEAAPDLATQAPSAGTTDFLMNADALDVSYPVGRQRSLAAVRGLSIALRRGETLALVGESGSGKTSVARAVCGLVAPRGGGVVFAGERLGGTLAERDLGMKRRIQLVFQDPVGSLSPGMTVADILAEPLEVHEPGLDRSARRRLLEASLTDVGLDAEYLGRYPHELSGGQAQRIAIARALVLRPELLVCDEAVAALDGSVRGRILAMLRAVQADTGLGILFIAHDLAMVKQIAHRVAVMYLGRIVEAGATDEVFGSPRHPYTQALIDAVPVPDPLRSAGPSGLAGEIPSPLAPPSGCAFHPRCRWALARCETERPGLDRVGDNRRVACWRSDDPELGARPRTA